MTLQELISAKPKELRLGQWFCVALGLKGNCDVIDNMFFTNYDASALWYLYDCIEWYNWDIDNMPVKENK